MQLAGAGSRAAGVAVTALATAGAAALAWGTLVERNRFTVRCETAAVLDPGSDPIRILHLSDLHMAPWQTRKQDWVRTLAELKPDLVINTGDNFGHADALIGLERALDPLAGIPGVFVHGSNDYFGPTAKNPFTYFTGPSGTAPAPKMLDIASLERYFANLGWQDLNNTAIGMTIKGSPLEFIGTGDAHRGWDHLEALPGALDELREQEEPASGRSGREAVTIGVTHAPYQRVLDSLVTHGAEMIFAGHTHGGQVCVPGVGALVTNCDLPRDRASGLSLWHHALRAAYLNVSAGIGTSIYAPVRFACRPEAVLVTLTSTDIRYS